MKNQTPSEEITSLTEELKRITLRTEEIAEQLQAINEENNTQDQKIQATTTNNTKTINIGDIVRVTNNYKGNKGVEGTVTRLLTKQAWIAPPNGGKPFRKNKSNLAKIENKIKR